MGFSSPGRDGEAEETPANQIASRKGDAQVGAATVMDAGIPRRPVGAGFTTAEASVDNPVCEPGQQLGAGFG
jgi:hypothetical protein